MHDLQSKSTTPAFSWITPDNCSDAHDAICAGNNLSGAFDSSGNPVYMPSGGPAYQPEASTPTNYTGGLYASDLFLKYYIPLIEQSAAFKDGGLIDVTFDEANPPFANSSFNNANNPGSTAGVSTPATARGYAQSDTAGESFNGKHGPVNMAIEPTGPNTPLLQDSQRQPGLPRPGRQRVHRPSGQPQRRRGQRPEVHPRRRQPDSGCAHRQHGRQRGHRQQPRSPTRASPLPTPVVRSPAPGSRRTPVSDR